jgi:hypothetical protein
LCILPSDACACNRNTDRGGGFAKSRTLPRHDMGPLCRGSRRFDPGFLRSGLHEAGQPVKLTYLRSQLSSQAAVVKDEIDPAFINDQYWLLFPFHLVWDSNAKVEDTGMQKLPLGKGSAKRVVVTYPSEGGYTPGDTWELFVGPDNHVHEPGSSPRSRIAAADYRWRTRQL